MGEWYFQPELFSHSGPISILITSVGPTFSDSTWFTRLNSCLPTQNTVAAHCETLSFLWQCEDGRADFAGMLSFIQKTPGYRDCAGAFQNPGAKCHRFQNSVDLYLSITGQITVAAALVKLRAGICHVQGRGTQVGQCPRDSHGWKPSCSKMQTQDERCYRKPEKAYMCVDTRGECCDCDSWSVANAPLGCALIKYIEPASPSFPNFFGG